MNQKWTALLLTTAMLATGASAALAYETLQPGSNGQEVLDARMLSLIHISEPTRP